MRVNAIAQSRLAANDPGFPRTDSRPRTQCPQSCSICHPPRSTTVLINTAALQWASGVLSFSRAVICVLILCKTTTSRESFGRPEAWVAKSASHARRLCTRCGTRPGSCRVGVVERRLDIPRSALACLSLVWDMTLRSSCSPPGRLCEMPPRLRDALRIRKTNHFATFFSFWNVLPRIVGKNSGRGFVIDHA